MSLVRLTPQVLDVAGITPSYTSLATADTYLISNNGRVQLHFKKTGAGDAIITYITPPTIDGLAIASRTDTVVATTGDRMVGKFKPSVYNDENGDMSFTSDEETAISVAVIQH